MKKRYLELFRNISLEIEKSLEKLIGTKQAKQELERGAFGDITVYIDKIAEDIVIDKIKQSRLQCSILSEESGLIKIGAEVPIVIVDPIDGSLNAKRAIPYFSFSIALSKGFNTKDIIVGYVKNLANKDEFYAMSGYGAFLNDRSISTHSEKLNIISVEGLKKDSDEKLITFIYKNFNKVRQMGSMALDICYLATGAFDIFLNLVPSRIIDYAAAKLILEETNGGLYQWLTKQPFQADISKKRGDLFFGISNKKLLSQFISILEEMK